MSTYVHFYIMSPHALKSDKSPKWMKNKLAQSQGLTAVTQQLNEYQSEPEHRM